MAREFIKARCIGVGKSYFPMGMELVLNQFYLVEDTKSDSSFIQTYYVYDESFIIYYGEYPKDNFMTIEEWREFQINVIYG